MRARPRPRHSAGMEDEFVDACAANAASSVLDAADNLRFDVLRSGAFYHLDHLALVPVRPRRRRELHSLRTFFSRRSFLSAHHPSVSFDPDARASTPFNSASDAFQLHPDVRRFVWTITLRGGPDAVRAD